MIMDEVLAVGDMAFQKKCLNKMRDVARQEGRTILYVSHNMNTIRQLCDRCVVLDKGKVIYEGDVDRAISVYMKENVDSRISYDYTDVERSPNESRKIQLLGLDILERDANLISQNEDLKFVLHCYANKDFNEIKLRFEIFYLDGTIVGTVFSDKKLSESKGTIFDIYMKMSNSSNL